MRKCENAKTRKEFGIGTVPVGEGIADGVQTLRTQDSSDPRHFGTVKLVPRCPDISTPVPHCLGTVLLKGAPATLAAPAHQWLLRLLRLAARFACRRNNRQTAVIIDYYIGRRVVTSHYC